MQHEFLKGVWWFLQQPAAAVIVAVAIPIVSGLLALYIRRRRHRATQPEEEVEEELESQVNFENATVNINPANAPAANANIEPITINVPNAPPGATTTIERLVIRDNEVRMQNVVIRQES